MNRYNGTAFFARVAHPCVRPNMIYNVKTRMAHKHTYIKK